MHFKYENMLYKLSFDGTILKYTRKPLLRWLLLNPFGTRKVEFPAREISDCQTFTVNPIIHSFRLVVAQWHPVKNEMTYRGVSPIYIIGGNKLCTSALSRIIYHETILDKKQQTWFIPRDYESIAG